MSITPDYVSEKLSEVMDNIGVNERVVMKRRRAHMLMEAVENLSDYDDRSTIYHFGSQSEGSTTLGLHSDTDALINLNLYNVIQNMRERKPGIPNLMMLQDENISPGYCQLQLIRPDLPLPATVNDIDYNTMDLCATNSDGRLVVKNTLATKLRRMYSPDSQINGPAVTNPAKHGFPGTDTVLSCYCESNQHLATSWFQKQTTCKWPTEDVQKDCRNVGFFVVPVGSKMSLYEPELEWRISTSLQERCLMFSLNITHLRCYILMKMILKTYINPHVVNVLSSFMCKNVLFYCIANSSHDWHTGNLLSHLHLCLFMLKECVEQRNCPHFMIPENNLLAGHMTDKQRGNLLDIINNLLKNKNTEQFLYKIQMDDLGTRLKMRLNMISYSQNFLPGMNTLGLVFKVAETLSKTLNVVLDETKHDSLIKTLSFLLLTTSKLERDKREKDFYQYTASELFIPLVNSTIGSVLANVHTLTHTAISDRAFTYLEAGKKSDALSGTLKLVSVLYCTGDMERAESELRTIQTQYNISEIQNVCGCLTGTTPSFKLGHIYDCGDYNETAITSHVAICTRFLQCEINCVPHELRYEILRSYIEEDRKMRACQDSMWMDLMVVDSIPYLYFLQYKTYGHLQCRKAQQEALSNLAQSIEPGLGHKETELNLLGQCMEHENRQPEAFQYYIQSLKYRVRNNAARLLLCIQLLKLWKQDNPQ